VNAPILRLFGVVLVLFAALVGFTSRWTVFEAEALQDDPKNARELLEELQVRRGTIRTADGTLLAGSRPAGGGTYRRRYTEAAPLVSHVLGYSDPRVGRTGIEESRNDALSGRAGALGDLLDQVAGRPEQGDDLRLTIDLDAQRTALQALGGRRGSVVAIEPSTGRVRVMANLPGYDPAAVGDPETFRALTTDPASPLLNRATQSGYPPGSTFKVVTATAALESGDLTPGTVVDGSSPKLIGGVPLRNAGGRDFGPIDLTTALTQSVNTVWGEVAERLGKETMGETMERFGFFAEPPIDLPAAQLVPSGPFSDRGRLLRPTSPQIDVGRMGIGQDRLRVTPLQMALVAAAVANGGELMQPTLTRRLTDPDGRTVDDIEPESAGDVMDEETADELRAMMAGVVREGTGTAAALQGISIAGKTGTAERNVATELNQPWFIGFGPVERPRIAIAVTVEGVIGGSGGTIAAPIARQVLESLLR
jgi:peptidoglycan glycosyltransferase